MRFFSSRIPRIVSLFLVVVFLFLCLADPKGFFMPKIVPNMVLFLLTFDIHCAILQVQSNLHKIVKNTPVPHRP